MGNPHYQKGYRFELEVKKKWENNGYKCTRSAKSGSPVDLTCIKDRLVIQIQCKDIDRKISRAEKAEITEWADVTGFPVIIMYKTSKVTNEYISPVSKLARV